MNFFIILLLTLVAVVSQILLSRHFEVNKWSALKKYQIPNLKKISA